MLFKGLVLSANVLEVILVSLITIGYIRRQHTTESNLCFNEESLESCLWKHKSLQNLTLKYGTEPTAIKTCFKTSEVLKAIVSQLMVFHYDTDMNPEPAEFNLTIVNLTESTEKLALLQLSDINSVGIPGKSSVIFWKTVLKQGDGLNYLEKEGMIAIQKSGYYHVTSHLKFLKENKTSSANDNKTGKHQVIRISNEKGHRSILLESTSSRCQVSAMEYEHAVYMAAVFKLEENDTIFVTVSHTIKMLSCNGTHYLSITEI